VEIEAGAQSMSQKRTVTEQPPEPKLEEGEPFLKKVAREDRNFKKVQAYNASLTPAQKRGKRMATATRYQKSKRRSRLSYSKTAAGKREARKAQ
jgi:hypothetical protein